MLQRIQRLLERPRAVRALGPLIGPYNPWDPVVREDPAACFAALRARARMPRSPLLRFYIASRYEDVRTVLRDPRFSADRSAHPVERFSRRYERSADLLAFLEHTLLDIDGEKHARLRGLVSRAFTPRRIAALRPRIEQEVEALLDRAAGAGEIEFMRELAHPLPAVVIAELLGVPREDRARFAVWSKGMAQLIDPLSGSGGMAPARKAAEALFAYFRGLLAERRERPRDDLLSAMLAAEHDGRTLEEQELLALATLLLVAGHETTTNLLGNAMLALLRHPGERKRLIDDPELMPRAVEEFLRCDPPVQLTDRIAAQDVELRGRRVRKGRFVMALIASANRDPEVFEDPDRLDLGRTENPHLSFGMGRHVCLGAALARLEAEIGLGAFLRRFPDFRGPNLPPARRRSVILRGPETLPLELRA